MLFRFTNAVLETVKDIRLEEAAAENRFCEWVCDIIMIDRKKYFFVSNSYSMVSVLFAANGITNFKKFTNICIDEIKRMCSKNGWESIFEENINPYTKSHLAAKNWNRSITAKMNHSKMWFNQIYRIDGNISEIEKYVNEDSMKNLGNSDSEYGIPKEVFVSDYMKLLVDVPSKRVPKEKTPKVYYQFYSELLDFSGKIWRRFVMDSNVKMSTLASCMIAIFEAQASHLYEFEFNLNEKVKNDLTARGIKVSDLEKNPLLKSFLNIEDFVVSIPDEESGKGKPYFYDLEGHVHITSKELDAFKTKILECFKEEGDSCTFTYDFGDGWEFSLKLEKIIQNEEFSAPFVLNGKGYGIFEDIGGTSGLEEVYKQFKQKEGDLYENISRWLENSDSNLETFEIDKMNKSLKTMIKMYDKAYKNPWF